MLVGLDDWKKEEESERETVALVTTIRWFSLIHYHPQYHTYRPLLIKTNEYVHVAEKYYNSHPQ